MDPRLRALVDAIVEGTSMGAAAGREPNRTTLLQEVIVDEGLEDEFSEDDLTEAVLAVGGSPAEVSGWLEGLASWL